MPQLFTIGYEGATVPEVLAALTEAKIAVLADVRAVAASRRPGFSKTALAANLAEAGIGYRHFRALGTPADGRAAARRGDQATLERIYAAHLTDVAPQAEMAMLIEQAREAPTVLLCYERAPEQCHRSLLFDALDAADLERVDLFPGGAA